MVENKQVRVDNWGIFFLQRLQLFFSKTDYCDLTLQFQGNVQLKVHRLVLNACTEYFELLEQSDRFIDDNTILMPDSLQADVVVPIINFMYTGMLEYPLGLYHKLYQAAELMHISVLTKLLNAQKQPIVTSEEKQKFKPSKPIFSTPTKISSPSISTKSKSTKNNFVDLPQTLPGRKLPVWKRKTAPHSSNISSFSRKDSRNDSSHANEAKPTRFEWPEDDADLPPLDLMDLSEFGDISYTSKPLLIEDEVKPIIYTHSDGKSEKEKEQISLDETMDQDISSRNTGEKRKSNAELTIDKSPKRIRIVEGENDTTISVMSSGNTANLDPTKIVSEILKKYPNLVKKKKNLKLKIISQPKENEVVENLDKKLNDSVSSTKDNVWYCKDCAESNGKPLEFMLYYLYRKHMTDIHNIIFDSRICKYCGTGFAKTELHSFHLFTKHGIKPSGNQVFPSCPQCPFVALSKQALLVHKNKHKSSEMQCNECKLAFRSTETIAAHIQITGHMGKNKKNSYDCQYCMKNSQSAISLLSHIKSNHEFEARRDGIVSLDEITLDEGVDLVDFVEEETEQEFLVPEISSVNKVKIISDVKVPATKNINRTDIMTLDPNKTHNVPTSIATSLGLLDIVVLDENQQYILQNQGEQTEENRTEYILPQSAVRGDGLETSTTDELVMVLTDQDYKEGHSTITSDNSNIVVLYSHPADGQQGQFITSQGNLMVNSETGLLEIRNGATIATTSANQITNQIVLQNPNENEVETIEMIQREIHGDAVVKEESFYEEKSEVPNTEEYIENTQEDDTEEYIKESEVTETSECQIDEIRETDNEIVPESTSTSELKDMNETLEPHISIPDDSVEEMETANIDEVREESSQVNDSVNETLVAKDDSIEENSKINVEDKGNDIAQPEEKKMNNVEENVVIINNTEVHRMSESVFDETEECTMIIKGESNNEEEVQEEERNKSEDEDKQVEVCEEKSTEAQETLQEFSENALEDEEKPYSPTDNPIDMKCEIESNTDTNDKPEEDSINENEIENENENSVEIARCESDTDNLDATQILHCEESIEKDLVKSIDESVSVSSNVTQESTDESIKDSTTIAILDDWEDTDSQQSDNKIKQPIKKPAQENVYKLMDDWEEDELEK